MIDISDITTLDPADIDRKMAHRFAGKRYAYVAVTRKGAFQLGVSVAGKVGFIPVGGMTFVQKIEARGTCAPPQQIYRPV